jgi:hypothetical protein
LDINFETLKKIEIETLFVEGGVLIREGLLYLMVISLHHVIKVLNIKIDDKKNKMHN